MASKTYDIAFQIGGKLQASLGKSMTTAAGQLDKIGRQISSLEKAQGTSNRFRSLHNEIDQTQLKLRQAEAALKHLGPASAQTTAEMASKFEAATSKVAALRAQFRAEGAELRSVNAAMAAAGISARTLGADQAKLAAQIAKAQAAQKRMRENQGARAANKEKYQDARGKVSAGVGNVLGVVAAASPFAIAVKLTADFEDSIVRAGALAKASAPELEALSNTARQLGRDYRYTAVEAATGMQYLAQHGFKTNEILAAMPGMLDIASAGAVDLGEAAQLTANILRGFGMEAGQTVHLGDVLTNTFTNSSTTLSTLGETLKYVAPIAKSLGVSLQTTAAAAGLLGSAGIKGEQAGTSMRAMFLRLSAPLKKGQKALDILKVKTMDAHHNLRPLADILTELSVKMQGLGTGTKAGMMKAIFGLEAATAATVLVGEAGSGNLQKFTAMVAKSGTAAEIAAKQNATLKGQWDNLRGTVEDLGIQVGYTLMPALKGFVAVTVPIINKVTEWLQLHPQLTEALVFGAAAVTSLALALAVAGLMFNGAKLAILATQGAMLLLNAATWKAVWAWMALNVSTALVVAAIGGLAYCAYQLYEAWKPVSEWWNEMWDGMFDKVAAVYNALPEPVRFLLSGSAHDSSLMVRGNVVSNFGAKAPLQAFINQEKAARDAKIDAFTNPKAEEPSWLKKKTFEEPSWLKRSEKSQGGLSGLDRIRPGSSKRGGDVTVNQTVNIPPGTPAGVGKEIGEASSAAAKELERLFRKLGRDDNRDEERTGLD